MNGRLAAFLTEVRNTPEFVAASAADPKWIHGLGQVERLLNVIDRKADDDPATVGIVDEIVALVRRRDLSLKQRLVALEKPFVQFRDAQGVRH